MGSSVPPLRKANHRGGPIAERRAEAYEPPSGPQFARRCRLPSRNAWATARWAPAAYDRGAPLEGQVGGFVLPSVKLR